MDPARAGDGVGDQAEQEEEARQKEAMWRSSLCPMLQYIYNKLILVQNFRNKSIGYIVKTSFTSI